MRVEEKFLVLFITIILFWYQTNSNEADQNIQKYKFYRRSISKRSPEDHLNEKNGECKSADKLEKTQIEDIQTSINSLTNCNEIMNDFLFLRRDRELAKSVSRYNFRAYYIPFFQQTTKSKWRKCRERTQKSVSQC